MTQTLYAHIKEKKSYTKNKYVNLKIILQIQSH
jgi:hypothetical protein